MLTNKIFNASALQMQQKFYALAAFFMFYKIASYIYCT